MHIWIWTFRICIHTNKHTQCNIAITLGSTDAPIPNNTTTITTKPHFAVCSLYLELYIQVLRKQLKPQSPVRCFVVAKKTIFFWCRNIWRTIPKSASFCHPCKINSIAMVDLYWFLYLFYWPLVSATKQQQNVQRRREGRRSIRLLCC